MQIHTRNTHACKHYCMHTCKYFCTHIYAQTHMHTDTDRHTHIHTPLQEWGSLWWMLHLCDHGHVRPGDLAKTMNHVSLSQIEINHCNLCDFFLYYSDHVAWTARLLWVCLPAPCARKQAETAVWSWRSASAPNRSWSCQTAPPAGQILPTVALHPYCKTLTTNKGEEKGGEPTRRWHGGGCRDTSFPSTILLDFNELPSYLAK